MAELPRPVYNLALRAMALMAASRHVRLELVCIEGVWYLTGARTGVIERLG